MTFIMFAKLHEAISLRTKYCQRFSNALYEVLLGEIYLVITHSFINWLR